MKKFKAWRYKCDFCGKNGYSAGHMRSHETGCTANPNRVCKMHKHVTMEDDPEVPNVSDLVSVLQEHKDDVDHGLKDLREAADDCPCCILSALVQSGFCKGTGQNDCGYDDGEWYSNYVEPLIGKDKFDFKKELEAFWSEERNMQQQKNLDQGYFEQSHY